MPVNPGHILTEDVVINYKKPDRDDCLHFLTHIDTSCQELSSFFSPTAKRIYTSIFNAWFLKINFDTKHIDIQGFETNKSYKIKYKGNKYIYSFIDNKFSTGTVALLLHGNFGTYLYTGNFCYSNSFVKSPVLLPVIKEKALNRLYLDNTYYEQPSDFLGFDEIVSKVVELIQSEPLKTFYLYVDKITMDPVLAEIACKLEEKVYICEGTMEIMKFLGYKSFFTRHSNESRIFTNKTLIKKRELEQDHIAVYLNRFSDPCKFFKKFEKKENVYNFNFYCHSRHKEICELLKILKPESMTFIYPEIKKSYDKELHDFPQTAQLTGLSTKSSVNIEHTKNEVLKKTPDQMILPLNTDKTVDQGNKIIIISKNRDITNFKPNDKGKIMTHCTSEYNEAFHTSEVREMDINRTPNRSNCANENINRSSVNLNCNNLKETSDFLERVSNSNTQSHCSSDSLQGYHKHEPKKKFKLIKLSVYNSAGKTLIPNNIKSLSSSVFQTKTGIPLKISNQLVEENKQNTANTKIMDISHIGMVFNGKKNTIVVKRKFVDLKKPHIIPVLPDDTKSTKVTDVENEKHLVTDESLLLLKSKTSDTDTNSNIPTLNFPEDYLGSKDNNSISLPNISFAVEKRDWSEQSQNENTHKALKSKSFAEAMDCVSLQDSFPLRQVHGIKLPGEIPAELGIPNHHKICSGNINSDDSTPHTEKPIMEGDTIDLSHSNVDPELESSTNRMELKGFGVNNHHVSMNNSVRISKRSLLHDENETPRKKLRSDKISQCLLQSNRQYTESALLKNCSVLLRRNAFEKRYFYCSRRNCYLPKFFGFRKFEIRPRSMLIALKIFQKLLKH